MNVAKPKPNKNTRRGVGRPTKDQAGHITEHIVGVATRLFLETSFEATSVDLIAAKARISKQTFYARFVSKEAVFAAVIRKGMDDLLDPAAGESDRAGPIDTALIQIGVALAERAFGPAALALYRLVASEAHQFPQLALAYREGGVRSREMIAEMFANAMRDGQIRSADAGYLAEQFLYAAIEGPARALALDGKIARSEKDLRAQVTAAVRLFLDGCRDRPARGA
ncbi:TetR/AcrR family transcriptional regulator [Methylocapsa sp. S129]|uniref:TetR/AcrR family transcriptional regulator n=1 Tax=Methylocapsa sp. S129 TaxID=1641869 RepID=UPI00131D1BFC|nr:TetR/AcrR family transcriptional regulator [Methylocapsa sp. S129]